MYEPKDYSKLIGMEGFSELLLKNHFKLYQGYVKNTNDVLGMLDMLRKEEKAGSYQYGELKRRLGWEFNGMRLHELYFDNLGGQKPLDKDNHITELLKPHFGSVEAWRGDFKSTGGMRGIGWVILYYDPRARRPINFWINEHDTAHPSGCAPLLVMDVWEHAFMIDYGLDKASYIDAFLKNINWDIVKERLKKAAA